MRASGVQEKSFITHTCKLKKRRNTLSRYLAARASSPHHGCDGNKFNSTRLGETPGRMVERVRALYLRENRVESLLAWPALCAEMVASR